jgi:hypothetical protein
VSVRVSLIVLLLLGLVIGWSGQLGDAGQGLAIYKISQATEKAADLEASTVLLREAREALEGSWILMRVSTYTGLAVVVVATLGMYLLGKRPPIAGRR